MFQSQFRTISVTLLSMPLFLLVVGAMGQIRAPTRPTDSTGQIRAPTRPTDSTDDAEQAREFVVSGSRIWHDTEIDLQRGDRLSIKASGTLRYPGQKESGPEGLKRGWRDLLRNFPLNDFGRGAFIGRIGESSGARPFFVGPERSSKVRSDGRLYLGINQRDSDTPEGSFQVQVEIVRDMAPPVAVDESRLPQLTQRMLDELPRRVVDVDGTLGDRVNFLILGSEVQVKEALAAGGWVAVNRSVKDAFFQGLLATLSRQSYTQLPMSELMMFDRPQDFGYALGDPLMVVAARHHFRIWKAPFSVDGETLWVGAGTHDIGFEKDKRTGKITHKIDPATDKERDFIGKSLEETGEVAKLDYMTAANPVTEAKTAHGASYHSDGRTLIVVLNPDQRDQSEAFANMFCSVLRDKNPDGGSWGDCSEYLETSAHSRVSLGPVSNEYRLLIVPGLMNTCFPGAPAYREGQEYLRKQYGLTVDSLPLPNDSCEDNADRIIDYIYEQSQEDQRRYIVLGYSKGAPDLQVAFAREPGIASRIAAFVTVAGASGGSPIADAIPGQADRWMRKYGLPDCKGDLSAGFKSLSQITRRAFLARYPDPMVPTYSIAAISDLTNTSKMLQQTWKILSAYSSKHDGQLTKSDAIVPGAKYLGAGIADHFAIGIPFETSKEMARSGADKNHYPRTALLEAIVRFVTRDLENEPDE